MESQNVVETTDVALAAFLATYQGVTPFKITSDIQEPFEATYHFRMSSSDFQKAKAAYYNDQTVTSIQTFVESVRDLQRKAVRADKQGGILSL